MKRKYTYSLNFLNEVNNDIATAMESLSLAANYNYQNIFTSPKEKFKNTTNFHLHALSNIFLTSNHKHQI